MTDAQADGLRDQIAQVIQEWRKDADELDEATNGQWIEPSVRRQCADQLAALLAADLVERMPQDAGSEPRQVTDQE